LTLEHLIPEALGGTITSRILCKGCNSGLGHRLEGKAKADPTIRLLAKKLQADIPGLASNLEEGQKFFTTGPGPSSMGYVKKGQFNISSSKLPDGSLIQDTPLAASTLRKMLKTEGLDPQAIESALSRFVAASDDVLIQLSPGIEVVKWSVAGLKLALDGPMLNLLVPAKSAYEFLALHVGTAIYENTPPLHAIRRALTSGGLNERGILVERLHAPEAKPFHGLVFEGNHPYAKVQVRVFGRLAFRVHFKCLSVAGPRGMYTQDLATKHESIAQLPPNDSQLP
jgi:hypothetical protein